MLCGLGGVEGGDVGKFEVEVGGDEGHVAKKVAEILAELPASDVANHDGVEVAVLEVVGEGTEGLYQAQGFNDRDGSVVWEGNMKGCIEGSLLVGVKGKWGGGVRDGGGVGLWGLRGGFLFHGDLR